MAIAILSDANDNDKTLISVDDASDAFLRRWEDKPDAKEPSDTSVEEDDAKSTHEDDEAEDTSDESPEESDDESDKEDTEDESDDDEEGKEEKPSKTELDDTAVVKVKVDGKEHEVPVKDLKRLWGQEQALNRKSEEASQLRKSAEDSGAKFVAGLGRMLDIARADYEPYSKINFLVAAKELDADELTALQNEAQKTYERVRYLEGELEGTLQEVSRQRDEEMRAEAREAVKVLSDPKTGIDGWGEKLYDEIRSFAITEGLPDVFVNRITNASAIKLLHKAMLYDKGQRALNTKTTKVEKTPNRVIKSSVSAESSKETLKGGSNKAMTKLRNSGEVDDAVDAFLSKWS